MGDKVLYLGNKQQKKEDANQIAGVYFFLCFVFDCKYTEQLYDIREEKKILLYRLLLFLMKTEL